MYPQLRVHLSVLILVVLVAPAAFGQGTMSLADSASFFPLDVNNSWTYIMVLEPPYEPPDTTWSGTYSVQEAVAIDDTLYYRVQYPYSVADTLRQGEDGNIWARVAGKDVLLFDFSLQEGASYAFTSSKSGCSNFDVTAERRDEVTVSAGTFENTVALGFDDPDCIDEESSYTFARGTGVIAAIGTLGESVELHESEVYPIPDTLDWHAYFPLETEARWQYEYENSDGTFGTTSEWIEDWFVAGDSVVNGESYSIIEVRCSVISTTPGLDDSGCEPDVLKHRLIRYDEEAANLVELHREGESTEERYLFQYDFALDAPFHRDDDPDGGLAFAYYYYRPEEPLMIDDQAVPAPQKGVSVESAVPGHVVFAHGIGLVSMAFSEGGGQNRILTYASVGNDTYGAFQHVKSEKPVDSPTELALSIYPNPASTTLQADYTVSTSASVNVTLYDVMGRELRSTQLGRRVPGHHKARIEIDDLAAGMYFISVDADREASARTPFVVVR